jgi:hypothetical protein
MKRLLLTAVLTVALVTPLGADLTLVQTGTGKGMGLSKDMNSTTYIKGARMRIDTPDGSTIKSMVFDVDAQKIYMFDNKKKEADVWDMAQLGGEIGKAVAVDGATMSVKPNGKTKQIAGRTTNGYDIAMTMPVKLGGEGGAPMTLNMTGETYIAKGAPGTADFIGFYKAAAEKGFIFGDPRAAKGSPGPAKAMAEMYEEFAKLGGVPYESNIQMKGGGEGVMSLMAKMFNVSSTSTVVSAETTALSADMFAPPAGYKLKPQK